MELPHAVFQHITGRLPEESDDFATERRAAPRVPLLSRGVIYPLDNSIGLSAVVMVQNISVSGVGLRHRERMYAGQEFVLQLPRRDGRPLKILCQVRRCEAADRGFVIGATFCRFVDADEPQNAIDAKPDVVFA